MVNQYSIDFQAIMVMLATKRYAANHENTCLQHPQSFWSNMRYLVLGSQRVKEICPFLKI